MASTVWGRVRQFDAYPKTLEDFRVKTFGGAASECVQQKTWCDAGLSQFEWTHFSMTCVRSFALP